MIILYGIFVVANAVETQPSSNYEEWILKKRWINQAIDTLTEIISEKEG